MDKKKIQLFAFFALTGMLLWGTIASRLLAFFSPDASIMQTYLFVKGMFALLLLTAMKLWGGWIFFGLERRFTWWFFVPSLPILLLTAGLFFSPEAKFGLGTSASIGWILVAVFVGIGEECLFRGILWRAFDASRAISTAFATSTLFGAAHLMGLFTEIPWQIVCSQAVFAFGVGMMFASVRLISGSLLAPIVMHALFDSVAILAAGGVNEMFDETLSVERLLIPGAFFAVWGFVNVVVIQKRRQLAESLKQNDDTKNEDPGQLQPGYPVQQQ